MACCVLIALAIASIRRRLSGGRPRPDSVASVKDTSKARAPMGVGPVG
jgi:hypothetical protein